MMSCVWRNRFRWSHRPGSQSGRTPAVLKPAMMTAINMQHHPGQACAGPSFSMRRPRSATLHQPGPLQHVLDPRIAAVHLVVRTQLLVKMPHIQIKILLSIQRQHPIHFFHRNLAPTRLALPLVSYPSEAMPLILPFPSAHRSRAHSQNLSRLPPCDLLRHGLQHHFSHSH